MSIRDLRPKGRSARRPSRAPSRTPTAASVHKLARELASVAAAAFVVLLVRSSWADHYVVPTGSMEPTVHVADRVLVHKAAYGWRLPLTHHWIVEDGEPAPGDVVVLEAPDSGEVLLKRVVAGPKDVVAVRAGQLWLNGAVAPLRVESGRLLEALGGKEHTVRTGLGGPDFGPVQVPLRRYLVLGDHRDNSHDGRAFGWVSREAILGRALGVYRREGEFVWIPL